MLYPFLLILFSAFSQNEAKAMLTLKIKDVRSEDGNMSVAIYKKEHDFMSGDDFYKAFRMAVTKPVTETEIELPPGHYAIAIYHDEDDNNKMAKSWIGIPQEPVGISRNAIGMSRPTFEDAAFEISDQPLTLTVDLKHF